ncbi:hypothetical protein F2Q69_00029260 [Brassica cretica]|uniref:Uncharacterized protein n=1 Tax=Brassica cretica TaxID=69181 RepID=A0A8S9RVF8_BRACR|nr:hypothetical protein F2Q69_00029260 [Brassica cretica]
MPTRSCAVIAFDDCIASAGTEGTRVCDSSHKIGAPFFHSGANHLCSFFSSRKGTSHPSILIRSD